MLFTCKKLNSLSGFTVHCHNDIDTAAVPMTSLSTRTGIHDGNVIETIKLIAEDKRST